MKSINFYFKRKRDEFDEGKSQGSSEEAGQSLTEAADDGVMEANVSSTTDKVAESCSESPAPAVASTSSGGSGGRTYKFNANWLKMFPWLELENNAMFCKYCRGQKLAGNSSFVSGNTQLKKDSVVKHGKSQRHIQCRDLYLLNKEAVNI